MSIATVQTKQGATMGSIRLDPDDLTRDNIDQALADLRAELYRLINKKEN